MNILITGAGGWLGSELTEKLLKHGNRVRVILRKNNDKINLLKSMYKDCLEIIFGDICDKNIIYESLENIEVVYHLAAKVHMLPKNLEDYNDFFRINSEASKNLFDICVEKKISRVIFFSSVSVYGDNEKVITVESKKVPKTAYAKSKLEAEEYALKLYKEKNLPITIIEPVTVYGGNDVGNFKKLRGLMKKGLMIRFGDGSNKKSLIYYKDLISMTINISNNKKSIGKIIICGTEILSINEINNILKLSVKNKVFNIFLGKKVSEFIIKSLSIFNISLFKKISRQIYVLKSNNIYDIECCSKYIDNFKTFKEYYNKE